MAIIIVEGVPGAGKTFDSLVRFGLDAIRHGRKLFTDIDGLNVPLISALTGRSVEQVNAQIVEVRSKDAWRDLLVLKEHQMVEAFAKDHPLYNSLVIIDEAQMKYPRVVEKDLQEWRNLLAWHRHLRMDMIFLTQSSKTLNSYVSELCQSCYSVKNLAFISSLAGRCYAINVREKPGAPLTTTLYGRYDPKYFGIYKTAVGEANSAFSLKVPQAIGGLTLTVSILAGSFIGFRIWSRGVLHIGGKKDAHGSAAPAVSSSLLADKKDLAVVGRDSVASSSLSAPAVSPMPAALTASELEDAGLDPRKTCYRTPQRQTWVITYHGKTERGWRDGSKIQCF